MALTHVTEEGNVRMVDVSAKNPTQRTALAEGEIWFSDVVAAKLQKEPNTSKGNIFECARIAGIMAAKKTSDLIPMCHPLFLTSVKVDFTWQGQAVRASCAVRCQGKTGVEMEALHGVSTALLTLYDMTKALGKESVIRHIQLIEKTGGKSGTWTKPNEGASS